MFDEFVGSISTVSRVRSLILPEVVFVLYIITFNRGENNLNGAIRKDTRRLPGFLNQAMVNS